VAVTFVIGLPGSGKTTYCLDAITENSEASFYIVPEQSSLQAERMLVNKSPSAAIMRAQALSFGRLAYHVFANSGGAPTKQLNDTAKHMLLRKILQECQLSFYSSRAIKMPGFIEKLSQTITEFSQYTIAPSDLENRSAKLTDLAEILRRYRENIRGRYLVTGETLELLSDILEESDYLRDGMFWVDGFKDFTPGELLVLAKLMSLARDITITLTMDNASEALASELDFFYATKRSLKKLRELAESRGVTVNAPIFLKEIKRTESADLQTVTRLFPKPSQASFGGDIEILAMQDKAAELTSVAEWIKRNVLEEKRWRFKDIAVLCGDLASYEKLARNIFEPYGIPLFIDSKMGLLSHPLTELIRAAIDVAVWDWQYEGVFRLLKTGFTGLPIDEIDRLENYVLARGIKAWRWRVEWQDFEDIRLRVQELIIKPEESNSVAGFAKQIYDWLYFLDIPAKLEGLLSDCEDQEQARWHRQIWPRIGEIFDKLVEILGEDTLTIKEFGDILEAGLKSADMGLIPPSLDQVVMGDIGRSRYPEIKALWVLGANDGLLPPPAAGGSLLTEDERAELTSTGLELAPDIPRQFSDNMLALYTALSQPRETLILSYSRAGSDGKPLRPSPVIARLKKIFPNLREGTASTSSEILIGEASPELVNLSRESAAILYGDSFQTSASRLESYARCPFAYFMNYNLSARERAIYEVRPMDLGILYHDVLAKATEELSRNKAWQTASRDDLTQIVNNYAEEVLQGESDHVLRSSARNMYILQRVKSICSVSLWALCEQYRRGEFETAGIETGIDGIVIPLENRQMIVSGRIDRVDVLGDYVKIIDYKSGATRFSVEEVQSGFQLQLLLYMNALISRSDKKPGGVFYFNIDDPILAVDEKLEPAVLEAMLLKQFKMSGLVLAEEDNVVGMDKHLQETGESVVIPVSIKKDGSFGKSSSVADAEGFEGLCQAVEDQVKEIGGRMVSGAIAPSVNLHCRYCRYAVVCET